MATNYPTSKQTFTDYSSGVVITSGDLNAVRDTLEAVEDKLGVNNSTDITSITYKVENISSVNPGHKHSTTAISDFNISSPSNGQVLQYNSTSSKWENGNSSQPDASTTVKGLTKLSVAPVSAIDPIVVGNNDTRVSDTSYSNKGIIQLNTDASTSGLTVSSGVVSVNTGTGANQVVKLDASSKLPAVDGSQLTNILKTVSASANVKLTKANEQSTTNTSWEVTNYVFATFTLKNCVDIANSVKISFDYTSQQLFSGANAPITVVKNGSDFATLTVTQIVANTKDTYRNYSVDVTGLKTGDVITVVAKGAVSAGGLGNPMTLYTKNITVGYDETVSSNTLV